MIIKKGYRLTVRSWENDADNYKTVSMDGLNEDQVRFYVAICKRMTPRCWDKNKFGNLYDPTDEKVEAFNQSLNETVEAHGGILTVFPDTLQEDIDDCDGDFSDWVYDALGDIGLTGGGEFFTRVCDKFTVEYVEQDIAIPDVTEQFK